MNRTAPLLGFKIREYVSLIKKLAKFIVIYHILKLILKLFVSKVNIEQSFLKFIVIIIIVILSLLISIPPPLSSSSSSSSSSL